MMVIYIPDKVMLGRPVDDPDSPSHGKILLKYPSGGVAEPVPPGLAWATFSGDSILDPQPAGFYQAVAPTGDEGRLFYISNDGDDGDDGLTPETAIQTIPRLQTLSNGRSGKNDVIMFDCMGSYSGALGFLTSGGGENKVIGFYNAIAATDHYGHARRPRIQKTYELHSTLWNNYGAAWNGTPVENLVFSGIDFYCERKDPDHPSFSMEGQTFSLFAGRHITFDDCRFMYTELTAEPVNELRCDNIRLSRNVFYGSYVNTSSYSVNQRPSNIYITGTDSFHGVENFSDLGGWHPDIPDAGANARNHNWYLAAYKNEGGVISGNLNDFHVEKNIFLRGASHGLHQRMGGIQEYNFAARCSIGIQLGYDNHPLEPGWTAISRFNVSTEGAMQERGINACAPGSICEGAVWAYCYATADSGPVTFEIHDNIASKLAEGEDFRTGDRQVYVGIRDFLGPIDTANQSGNIAYEWTSPEQGHGPNYLDPGRTLADYHAHHGGSGSFEECAAHFRERPLRAWNPNCTGYAIQEWVREGFEIIN